MVYTKCQLEWQCIFWRISGMGILKEAVGFSLSSDALTAAQLQFPLTSTYT